MKEKKASVGQKSLRGRDEEIRQLWESKGYTMAEISRKVELTRERIRQILVRMGATSPTNFTTSNFNWDAVGELRKLFGISLKISTYRLIESGNGIYKVPRKSKSAIKYFNFVLSEIEERLSKVEKLLEKIDYPTDN